MPYVVPPKRIYEYSHGDIERAKDLPLYIGDDIELLNGATGTITDINPGGEITVKMLRGGITKLNNPHLKFMEYDDNYETHYATWE